ncbi:hypothetical protein NQ317_013044 [Molorchus minor]|uniref:Uncharacterized protein n=1 Tax=Molorchus minor TaxID=1323400 RepID=A0ABQ9K2I6_9CUCU|nr:hypothetical protein NQ317_013044 [Molorchus minor]
MWRVLCLFIVLVVVGVARSEDAHLPPQLTTQNTTEQSEKKLSQTIMDMLDHFKQDDPIGLPGGSHS